MKIGSFVNALESLHLDLIMWAVLGVSLCIFSVYSAVLVWHWKLYSTGKFTTIGNLFVYLGVAGGFLLIMLLSILWYTYV